MASLLNTSINYPPIFDVTNFSLWKCRMKSFIRSIDFDFWDIISNDPFVPNEQEMMELLLSSQRVYTLKMTMRGLRKILEFYMFATCSK